MAPLNYRPDITLLKKTIRQQEVRVGLRDPLKYWRVIGSLKTLSTLRPERGLVAQAAYYSMRYIDDVIDGDLEASHPREYAVSIRDQIASNKWHDTGPIAALTRFAVDSVEAMAGPEDDPRQDFLTIMDAMITDFDRTPDKKVFTSTELNDYYHNTFSPIINIALIGTGSENRVQEIQEFPYALARMDSIRDLREDWPRGLINIPGDVLGTAHLTEKSSIDEVEENHVVQGWIKLECVEALQSLSRVEEILEGQGWSRLTRTMLSGMIKKLRRFAEERLGDEGVDTIDITRNLIERTSGLEAILAAREEDRLNSQSLLTQDEVGKIVDERVRKWYAKRTRSTRTRFDMGRSEKAAGDDLPHENNRIAPYLFYLTLTGYGGEASDSAFDIAAGLEILQNTQRAQESRSSRPANLVPVGHAFELITQADIEDSTKMKIVDAVSNSLTSETGTEQTILNPIKAGLILAMNRSGAGSREAFLAREFTQVETDALERFAQSFAQAHELLHGSLGNEDLLRESLNSLMANLQGTRMLPKQKRELEILVANTFSTPQD